MLFNRSAWVVTIYQQDGGAGIARSAFTTRQDVCRSNTNLVGDTVLFVLKSCLVAVVGREFQSADFAELSFKIRFLAYDKDFVNCWYSRPCCTQPRRGAVLVPFM